MPPQIDNQIDLENIKPKSKLTKIFLYKFPMLDWLNTKVLIFVFLIIIGYSVWFVYNSSFCCMIKLDNTQNVLATTTDEFAGWKTYRNTKYGYEFKYPDGVGVFNENYSNFIGPPNDPNKDLLLIYDANGTFHFEVDKGVLSEIATSSLSNKIVSTFKLTSTSTSTPTVINSGENQPNITIPPIIEGAIWEEVFSSESKKYFEAVYSDSHNSIYKNINFSGKLWETTVSSYHFPSFPVLDRKLRDSSWSQGIDLKNNKLIQFSSSGGPKGESWGFMKLEGNKLKIIGFSVGLIEYIDTTTPDSPFTYDCPCKWEISIFESDPLDITEIINTSGN